MVAYILSLADKPTAAPRMSPRGTYVPADSTGAAPQGVIVLRAAYTDRGANGMPAISKEQSVVLRAPTVVVASGEMSEGVQKQSVPQLPVEITVVSRPGASVKLKQLDLTSMSAVTIVAMAPAAYQASGGSIEIHRDSAAGPLLGTSEPVQPTADSTAPPARLRVALQPTSEVHDLYLVFRNPQVKGDGFLFAVLTATFESEARPATKAVTR